MLQDGSDIVVRYAGRVRTALILVLVGTIAVEAWALGTEWRTLAPPAFAGERGQATQWLNWACNLLSGIAVSVGLLYLTRLVGALARTGRMVPPVTDSLKSFAYCVLAAAGSTSILPFVVGLAARALNLSNAPVVTVVGSDLLLLLVAGVLVPITHLLASANQAQEELDRIV